MDECGRSERSTEFSHRPERNSVEQLIFDSPDQFILAQLRGAAYYTVARNVRNDVDGSDSYSGPLWDLIRVEEPRTDERAQPLSSSRLYYINIKTGLIDKIVSEYDGVKIEAHVTRSNAPPFPFDAATNSVRASVTVTFDENTTGNNLIIAVAHEGKHVSDAQAFATALTADLANGGTNAQGGPTNLTWYDREVRAYTISASMAQGLRLPNLLIGNTEIWNSGWRAADRAQRQQNGINTVLSTSPNYRWNNLGLSPQNPGPRYIP